MKRIKEWKGNETKRKGKGKRIKQQKRKKVCAGVDN